MARKKKAELNLEGDEISTVYGDLITFIMVLFILLFVLSHNQAKDETFFKEMRLKFGAKKIEQEDLLVTQELFVSKIQNFIKEKEIEDEAKLLVDEQKVTLILSTPILFDSGKAELKPSAIPVLEGIAYIFKMVENPVIIEGHTDNVPIHTDKFESNWDLSFYRAYSVLKFFISKFDYSPEQLSAIGYGEFRPIVENDTPENRALNRRIAINIIRVSKAASLQYKE